MLAALTIGAIAFLAVTLLAVDVIGITPCLIIMISMLLLGEFQCFRYLGACSIH